MELYSTRDSGIRTDALGAVLTGIAGDGGLFVPSFFPALSPETVASYAKAPYADIAADVLGLFFDEMPTERLREITRRGYAGFEGDPAPLAKLSATEHILELWHGPTLAFKDMALQVLPGLLAEAKQRSGDKAVTLILVATSGDTGKAALEGFADAPGVEIIVFFPDEGVSDMQKLQMVTQEGGNTHVAAVRGNFDDAQTGVKEIFADQPFNAALARRGYALSSANSINFGRLAPQVAYYVGAYAKLLAAGEIRPGERVNFAVPTGNFGNILAAYYAREMGLPINKLICASNRNNVLTDFFHRGEYQSRRAFYKTSSPSMDILISSNLERLLFEVTGRDGAVVAAWMKALKEQGEYQIGAAAHERIQKDFYAGWCSEEDTFACIKRTFEKYGYLLDPHTAVAQAVYEEYARETGDTTKTVVVSTASPFKFHTDVLNALGQSQAGLNDFESIKRLSGISGRAIPQKLAELKNKPVRHNTVTDKKDMKQTVESMLK